MRQVQKAYPQVHRHDDRQHSPHACQQRQFQRPPERPAAMPGFEMGIPSPAPSDEMKNISGSSGEYHRGYSFSGTIRKSVPSELWCSVESSTPRIIKGTEIL